MMRSLLVVLLAICPLISFSQEVLSSQGGSYKQDGISMDFTIGESLINSYSTETQQIGQGFHQDLLRVTAVDVLDPSIKITLFPNPVINLLNVQVGEIKAGMTFRLITPQGRQVAAGDIKRKQTEVSFDGLSQGNYILSIIDTQNQTLKSYTIIKN